MVGKRETAIITDASNPAAEAIAKRLEYDGITVIRNYPYEPHKALSGEAMHKTPFNTCSVSEMEKLLKLVAETTGNVNYLIHTDNVIFRASIEEITENQFKYCIEQNAKSAFITTKVFGEHIAAHGKGALLYLSTLHDEKPTGCAFAYSTAKGAVKMLCREMALFYGRKGIRANLLEMDILEVDSESLDSQISPFNYDTTTKTPLHRTAEPEDFAGAAAFLLSDEAAFINGAEIRIDGGHLLYYYDR